MPDFAPRTPVQLRRPPFNSSLPSLLRPTAPDALYVPKSFDCKPGGHSMDGRIGFGKRKGVVEAGAKRNESHVFGWHGGCPSGHADTDRLWVRQTHQHGGGSHAVAIQGLADNFIGSHSFGPWTDRGTVRPARTPATSAPSTPAYHPISGQRAGGPFESTDCGVNRHGAVAGFDKYVRPPASGRLAVGGSYQIGLQWPVHQARPPPTPKEKKEISAQLPRRTVTGRMANEAVASTMSKEKLTPDQSWAHWKIGGSYAFNPSSRDYGLRQNILQPGWFG